MPSLSSSHTNYLDDIGSSIHMLVNQKSLTHSDMLNNNCLIDATSKFVDAVACMKESIMLPSRLNDIPNIMDNGLLLNQQDLHKISTTETHQNGYSNGFSDSTARSPPSLYSQFLLIDNVCKELNISCAIPEENETDKDETILETQYREDNSYVQANLSIFRSQLKALMETMDKLTNSAYFLAQKYQENTGDQIEPSSNNLISCNNNNKASLMKRRRGSLRPLF